MDHMLPSPSFNIPSIGTPLHQPEEDLILPHAQHQQNIGLGGHHHGLGHPSPMGMSHGMHPFSGGMPSSGLTPHAHSGLTPHPHSGLTPHAHSGLTPHPHSGLTPHPHSGLTPHAHSGLTPHAHSGLTPHAHSGLTPHSLMQPQTPQNILSPALGGSGPISSLHQPMSVSQQMSMGQFGGPATPGGPMTPMMSPMTGGPSSADPGIVPQLQNIVSTVNLGCKLDLKKIALHARNAEYNPKRFAAVIMRIREPRTTALIFSSGKMVCTGAKSEEDSRLAARKYARIVQKLGFPAKFLDFKIQNMVGSCDVKFPIRLEGLVLTHSQFSSYEPELFPGLIYRMVKPRIVLLIFVSGKVVLTGAKVRQEIYEAFENIYPILKSFKKQ